VDGVFVLRGKLAFVPAERRERRGEIERRGRERESDGAQTIAVTAVFGPDPADRAGQGRGRGGALALRPVGPQTRQLATGAPSLSRREERN
jgi:hypothetical protein